MGNASSRNNNSTNNSAASNQSPAHPSPPQPYPYPPPAPTYSSYNAPHPYYQAGYGGAPAYGSNPPNYGVQPAASPYHQGQGPPVPSPYMPYSYPVPTQQYQRTATIRNPVNLKKGTLKLEQQDGSQSYVLSFIFDATSSCRVLLFLLAQEDSKHGCKITSSGPSFPAVSFSDGLEQKFPAAAANAQQQLPVLQLSASVLKDLVAASNKQGGSSSSSSSNSTQQTYPIIVRLEALTEEGISQGHSLASLEPGCALPEWVQSQTTYARVVEEDGKPLLHVVRQKIWVKGHSYELQEIYGMEQNRGGVAMGTPAAAAAVDGVEDVEGNECVICMSAPRDTAALPCRHMCMCHTCAGALRTQTNKCPICRDEIAELLHIKLNKGKQ